MPRNVRITLISDHVETVKVANDTSLEALFGDSEDEFVVIPTLNGGQYCLPKRSIVAIVKDGSGGERPRRAT